MWTLVTGAGGFVGGHVTRHLFKRGMAVAALQRAPRVIDGVPDDDRDNFRRVIGDLTALPLIDLPIDNIVHLAARINAPDAIAIEFEAGNVATTGELVKLAVAKGCSRVVALSTISVYGWPEGTSALHEETPITGPAAYGASKYRAELMLRGIARQARVTVLRTPGIVGRAANPNLVVRLCEIAARGEEMRITNPDAPFNSIVHVSDICRITEQLLGAAPNPGCDVVNLASAEPMTIRALAETIIAGTGSSSEIAVDPGGEPPRLVDITRLRKVYGFEPLTVAEAVELYASGCK